MYEINCTILYRIQGYEKKRFMESSEGEHKKTPQLRGFYQ